jgi:hypothetical protein
MNYVKQAYELDAVKKQSAIDLYKEAVSELVHKDYVLRVDDAHTELSAIFGQKWLISNRGNGAFWLDGTLYAEANIAFNYANFTLGIDGRFVALAESLVDSEQRINEKELKEMSEQMDSILTATTAKYFESYFVRN